VPYGVESGQKRVGMNGEMMKILDPTGRPRSRDTGLAPRAPSLGGSTLGVITNVWRSFDVVASHFEQIARERYEVGEIMRTINPDLSSPIPEDTLNVLVGRADVAIVGMGH
jgi:hypothetical protein